MGITKTDVHSENINVLATLFNVLGHPARISILFLLKERGYATVGEMTETIGGLAQATISDHLKELKKIPLIIGTPVGTSIQYRLHDAIWVEVKSIISLFANEF